MNKYNWENKVQFLIDWNASKNIGSFLKEKGLTMTSGNYQTFKKWYKIHTEGYNNLNDGNVFIENSIVNRKTINKLIIKFKLIKYECIGCKNNGYWNGKKLQLQLEHKNGINNDNRIENLAYICANCHSQTNSFTGSNVHNKVFDKRLSDITELNINVLFKEHLLILSKIWNVDYISALYWIRKYKNKLSEFKIYLDKSIEKIDKEKRNLGCEKYNHEKELYLSIKDEKTIKLNDIFSAIKTPSPNISLAGLWGIDVAKVKLNIKNLELTHLHPDFEIKKPAPINEGERKEIILRIVHKKQVPNIAKQLGITTNGLKKWIRDNLPDQFDEIYDNKHLVKNQLKVKKQEKENYIKFLKDGFNEEDVLLFLKTNKSGLYSLIKRYNLELFNELHNKCLCPNCNSPSRDSGKRKKCVSCKLEFDYLN